jgi:ubiquinone/menaquinone biosynthesis C-methylase UbiE
LILDIGVGEKPRGDINLDVIRTKYCNLVADAQYLPIKSDSIDIVLCSQVLEHLEDPKRCLREIKRVLRCGGIAVIDFPKPFFTNNIIYRLFDFILNIPFSFSPKYLIFLFRSMKGYREQNPRYFHKHVISRELIRTFFSVEREEEFGDIFLSFLNKGRKSRFFKRKPAIFTAYKLICRRVKS